MESNDASEIIVRSAPSVYNSVIADNEARPMSPTWVSAMSRWQMWLARDRLLRPASVIFVLLRETPTQFAVGSATAKCSSPTLLPLTSSISRSGSWQILFQKSRSIVAACKRTAVTRVVSRPPVRFHSHRGSPISVVTTPPCRSIVATRDCLACEITQATTTIERRRALAAIGTSRWRRASNRLPIADRPHHSSENADRELPLPILKTKGRSGETSIPKGRAVTAAPWQPCRCHWPTPAGTRSTISDDAGTSSSL
jgi:hypothetical protein